jgi:hypothetical protein
MIIVCIFAIIVLAIVGKLIYDVQQNKTKPTETIEAEAEKFREQWQNLAGIGTPKSAHNTELLKELADKWSKAGFPESDQSIPVSTTKITTIDSNFDSDKDPLVSVPMSRVSNKAKQKMAEIAREDINKQLEQNADKFAALFPNGLESNTEMPEEIKKVMMEAPNVKPKRKYTKRKPKQ